MPGENQSVELKPSAELPNVITWEDVPLDIFRHLNVELGTIDPKEIGKIREIYQWAKSRCEDPTIGNILQRINTMENQLGAPGIHEQRWDKTWRWIRLQRQVDDLQKRQEVLRKRWNY